MDAIFVLGGVISGVVYALVELLKYIDIMPKRFLPLAGVAIGVIAGYLSYPFSDLDTVMRLWAGLVAGLGATGFFELIKTDKKKEELR